MHRFVSPPAARLGAAVSVLSLLAAAAGAAPWPQAWSLPTFSCQRGGATPLPASASGDFLCHLHNGGTLRIDGRSGATVWTSPLGGDPEP